MDSGCWTSRILLAFLCMATAHCHVDAHPGHSGPTFSVTVGIDGRVKLGQWTQIQLHVDAGESTFDGSWQVIVSDGDGFKVTYTSGSELVSVAPSQQSIESMLVRVGRAPWRIEVEVLQQDSVVYSKVVSVGSGIQAIRATDYWIMQVGSKTSVNQLSIRRLVSENEQITDVYVTSLDDVQQLPIHPRALDGIDVIVLGTSDKSQLDSMTESQIAALVNWVKQGGQIVLSAARNAEYLVSSDNPIHALIPGNIQETHEQWIATGIENYIKARERISSARIPGRTSPMLELTDVAGHVEAMDGVGDTGRIPVLIHSRFGFGKVAFAAVDFDLEPFASWADTQRLLHQMIAGEQSGRANSEVFSDQTRGAHAGFDDLSGQLRSQLDHFDNVAPIRFSWIASLLILFILLIGPVDYFVLKRLNRLQLSWLTFTTLVVIFSVVPLLMHSSLHSSTTSIRQVEVVDYDIQSGQLRGTNWAMLYAPEASAVDVNLQIHDDTRPTEQIIGWHGLPGTGLGGLSRRSYQKLLDHEYQANPVNGELRSLPIPHGGTRYIQSRWSRQQPSAVRFELKPDRSRIGIRGTIHNPFDFQLRDVLVYYRGRLYPVKILEPDSVIDLDDLAGDSVSIQGYFTRVKVEGGRSRARPWSTSDESIVRLVQAMMFHKAVGGKSYTGLVHRYDGFMDLSHLLDTNRAVLFGWSTKNHQSEISISGNVSGEVVNNQWSFYRVSFPSLSSGDVATKTDAAVLGD